MQNFTDAVYNAVGCAPADNPDDVVALIRKQAQESAEFAQFVVLLKEEAGISEACDTYLQRSILLCRARSQMRTLRHVAGALLVDADDATPDAIMRRVAQLTQIEAQLCAAFGADAQLTPEAVAFGIAQLRQSAEEAQ